MVKSLLFDESDIDIDDFFLSDDLLSLLELLFDIDAELILSSFFEWVSLSDDDDDLFSKSLSSLVSMFGWAKLE